MHTSNMNAIVSLLTAVNIFLNFTYIQISIVKGYEEEAMIGFASLLDVEGKTEEAISTLETINNVSSSWHLAQASPGFRLLE